MSVTLVGRVERPVLRVGDAEATLLCVEDISPLLLPGRLELPTDDSFCAGDGTTEGDLLVERLRVAPVEPGIWLVTLTSTPLVDAKVVKAEMEATRIIRKGKQTKK